MVKIGNVEIRGPLTLAPMAGVTDAPFRALCRAQGLPQGERLPTRRELLGLILLLDLAANLLARCFDLADGFSAALDSVADLLIQAALLLTLLPRFPELGVAVWALLARLVLALVPDWIALLRMRRARLCGGVEKALTWLGCALLVPLCNPTLSAGGARTLSIVLSALIAATIPLRMSCTRRSWAI